MQYEFIAKNNEVISRAFNLVYSQTLEFSCMPLPSSLACNSIDRGPIAMSWNAIVVVPQATVSVSTKSLFIVTNLAHSIIQREALLLT
ncbi:hypothetical protein P8452_28276 [Trifolium repens]|nr:hypothetical protein P8452_28276 [Trifolium repens]